MDATVARLPHRSLRRRLRRRFPLPPWLYLLWPLSAVPPLAGLAWLLRDQGWAAAADVTRMLWLISCASFGIVHFVLAALYAAGGRDPNGLRGTELQKHGRGFLQLAVLYAVTSLSLLFGRIDWAILTWSGGAALIAGWHLLRFPGHTWRESVRWVPNALLAVTIFTGRPDLFAVAAGLSLLWPVLLRASLAGLVAEKRSREEFVRHEVEECG